MRNRSLAMIGLFLLLLTGYSKAEKFKTFEVETKGIKIEIDTKLELFHIMAYLANSDHLNNFDFRYKSDINTFFALYKNDNSVQFIKKVLQNYNAHLSINGQFFDANFKKDTSFLQFLQLDDFGLPNTFVVDNDAKFGNSDMTNLQEGKMAAGDYIYYGATHEIGHSFLNPIMDNYIEQINQIPFQYSTGDPSKITFLCESFLRSLTAYFLIINKYGEFAQMVIQGEKQQGYVYNEIIVDLIKDYANNRNIYKSFNDYVPVFLNKLKQKVENQ